MRRTSQVEWAVEIDLWKRGFRAVAGLDEAGRGALAGPVVAAAVMFSPGTTIDHVDDSKRLSPEEREDLLQQIRSLAVSVGVGVVEAAVIDRVNIRQGTLWAMRMAIQELLHLPDYALVDGRDEVPISLPQRAIVGGDRTVGSIAAASIVAKVTRDRLMKRYDSQFPGYGFAQHKGYGTPGHLQALGRLGPTLIHRKTFRGVSAMVDCHG